jgi:hypothetical protein
LQAGRSYLIDLRGDLGVSLRVENADYATLAVHLGGPPDDRRARLVFTAPADGRYRLVAAALQPGATGEYTLTVQEVSRAGADRRVKGELKATDPVVGGRHRKTHAVELVAGRPYVFEMDSFTFVGSLLLTGPAGEGVLARTTAVADFAGVRRFDFTPTESGAYTLVVTSVGAGQVGLYALRVAAYEPK